MLIAGGGILAGGALLVYVAGPPELLVPEEEIPPAPSAVPDRASEIIFYEPAETPHAGDGRVDMAPDEGVSAEEIAEQVSMSLGALSASDGSLQDILHSGAPTSNAADVLTSADGVSVGGAPPASRVGANDTPFENPFFDTADEPTSTFSIDVDTASYAQLRRTLDRGRLPDAPSVRIEEMLNSFDYGYAGPAGADEPFAFHTEVGDCPWNPEHRLLHIGVQGRRLSEHDTPARNLVFLVDVSGSMSRADKLPLLTEALGLLVRNLRSRDRVSIVVYAGAAGLVLRPTSGANGATIRDALRRLRAGGSTNGGQGIQLAYDVARASFIPHGINRVVLATDGDFNVGLTSGDELDRLIVEQRRSGVFLTVLGFGDTHSDRRMEQLADHGNGNYAFIDSIDEAERVLVRESGGTLWTIAQDVKLQLELDPAHVRSYRLIGYENRVLRNEDFDDDTRDAGEIGAGHDVTALYEIDVRTPGAIGTLAIRHQPPGGGRSVRREHTVVDRGERGSARLRFAASVAGFGMLLRGSTHLGACTLDLVRDLASDARGEDPFGHRAELIRLMTVAGTLGL